MKKIIYGVVLLMIMFMPCFLSAGEIKEDSLVKLMVLSGLNKQVTALQEMIMTGMEQERQQQELPIPDEIFKEMQKSVESSFRAAEILSITATEIKKNISESEAKELLAWYESDTGKRIKRAEEDASTPAAYQEMIKEVSSLFADAKRVQYARIIDNLANVTEMAFQLQLNTGIAVLTAISMVTKPDQKVNLEAYKAQIAMQGKHLRTDIAKLVTLSFLYSYKSIDTDSLEKYIAFLENPTTRKFNVSVMNGMKYALNQSIDKMSDSLVVMIKNSSDKANKKL